MDRLKKSLDAMAARGQAAVFWLRDDDATEPGPALDRLLGLDVPMTIAAIPAGTGQALADRLAVAAAGVSVAVHGWDHANHARSGEKKQELGPHRALNVVAGELARGLSHLRGLTGARCLPILVPPWNRIAPEVEAALPSLGFAAVSAFGPVRPAALPMVNANVDIIDWRGSRGGKPTAQVEDDILRVISAGTSVGLLTHHLAHDRAAWAVLGAVVAATRNHPACDWVGAGALIPRVSTG
jgi:peptidoglycan/xylan/chitin deacetylase (PgdA/CDA1 family)